MIDIKQILSGRKIVDAYRKEQMKEGVKDTSVKLLKDIQALRFEDVGAFFGANKKAIEEDMQRCVKFVGVCDFCVGREPGCVRACYDEMSSPDPSTPTGRTPLTPAADAEGKWKAIRHNKKWWATQPPAHKGRITPSIPNCSILTEIIEEPALNWRWS